MLLRGNRHYVLWISPNLSRTAYNSNNGHRRDPRQNNYMPTANHLLSVVAIVVYSTSLLSILGTWISTAPTTMYNWSRSYNGQGGQSNCTLRKRTSVYGRSRRSQLQMGEESSCSRQVFRGLFNGGNGTAGVFKTIRVGWEMTLT